MRRKSAKTSKEQTPSLWRRRLSLRSVMTLVNVLSILSASLIAGYYALTLLYQNKLSDTWAIMFLELEHQGALMQDKLAAAESILNSDRGQNSAGAVLRVASSGRLVVEQGSFPAGITLADLGFDQKHSAKDLPALTVVTHAGVPYLLQVDQADERRLRMLRLPWKHFHITPAPPASQGYLYLLTREGRLLYTSDQSLTEVNAVKRPLVQQFISAPIKQSQTETTDPEGNDIYGFYSEIPRTNIVMFSEVRYEAAMAPVRQVILRFLGALGMILLGAVILLQVPLSRITEPVRELAQLATRVGQGQFEVEATTKGLGELSVLSNAFSSMASGLVERDKKVAALMVEQAEKARMEGELAIARRIQENLLPRKLPKDAALQVASEYIAAAECAGDWYYYSYDDDRKETVVVVADVSGHGAGSSMFTAIIAGLFEEYRTRRGERFDLEGFACTVNSVIHRLGRNEWHATMMVARYVASDDHIEVLLAGHPAPIIRQGATDHKAALHPPFAPTSVLGISPEFNPVIRKVPFAKGSTLLAYTDGLTEAASDAGKSFSRRRVRESLLQSDSDPTETLDVLLANWRAYLQGEVPNDDVCVVVIKAA